MPQLILCVALLLLLVGLHSSFAYTPTSSSSITHPVLIWSGPAHRYLHSAHHPHCPSTISSFNELMSDIAHHREVCYIKIIISVIKLFDDSCKIMMIIIIITLTISFLTGSTNHWTERDTRCLCDLCIQKCEKIFVAANCIF